jgi:hypothetical protein
MPVPWPLTQSSGRHSLAAVAIPWRTGEPAIEPPAGITDS